MARGSVHVPDGWTPSYMRDNWKIYRKDLVNIIIFSRNDLGILAISMEDGTPDMILEMISNSNKDPEVLARSFTWPDGKKMEYDPDSRRDRLVIKSYNGKDIYGNIDKIPYSYDPVE